METAQTQEDKRILIEKFFKYTESTIKEWLAEYLNTDVRELFPDYTDESDVIGLEYENKNYIAYVVTMPAETPRLVDMKLLDKCENMQKACSMLYDAVNQVFLAIIATAENKRDKLSNLMPAFDEDTMSFQITRINMQASKLRAACMQNNQIKQLLESQAEPLTEQQQAYVQSSMEKIKEIYSTITQEMLDEEEKICQLENSLNLDQPRLHIVIEESTDVESGLDRLPEFGYKYQDPEEDNYIDKLKKANQ